MNKKYYECYSIGQMKFLRENGIEPVDVDIHRQSKNTIWKFERNRELSILLARWTKRTKTMKEVAV